MSDNSNTLGKVKSNIYMIAENNGISNNTKKKQKLQKEKYKKKNDIGMKHLNMERLKLH